MIEMLLDTYAPIQKLAKAQSKLKSKPWLTRGIMTSIKKKNKIYKKFIKAKNSTEKNILYEFKNYRNLSLNYVELARLGIIIIILQTTRKEHAQNLGRN